MAAQSRYGVPAAVTIAQAIEESDWGQSPLASQDHNLFGMKGTGPAGSDLLPTQEFENGQWVTTAPPFACTTTSPRASTTMVGCLLPPGLSAGHGRRAPQRVREGADRRVRHRSDYGCEADRLMQLYNLYRYDAGAAGDAPHTVRRSQPATGHRARRPPGRDRHPGATGDQGGTVGPGAAGGPGAPTGPGRDRPRARRRFRVSPTPTPSGRPDGVAAAQTSPGPSKPRRPASVRGRVAPRGARAGARASRYVPQIPQAVTTAFIAPPRPR